MTSSATDDLVGKIIASKVGGCWFESSVTKRSWMCVRLCIKQTKSIQKNQTNQCAHRKNLVTAHKDPHEHRLSSSTRSAFTTECEANTALYSQLTIKVTQAGNLNGCWSPSMRAFLHESVCGGPNRRPVTILLVSLSQLTSRSLQVLTEASRSHSSRVSKPEHRKGKCRLWWFLLSTWTHTITTPPHPPHTRTKYTLFFSRGPLWRLGLKTEDNKMK